MSLDEFYFAINDVRPSLIRVEADEVTYNLHILIRFELELALIDGDLQRGRSARGMERKVSKISGHHPARRRPGRVAGRALERGTYRLFSHLFAGQSLCRPVFRPSPQRTWAIWMPCSTAANSSRYGNGCGRRSTAKDIAIPPPSWSSAVTGRPLSHEPLMAHLREKFYPLYGL